MPVKKLFAAIMAIAVWVMVLPHPSAHARPEDGVKEGSGRWVDMPRTGRDWYGAFHIGQQTAFCSDLLSDSPRLASAWTQHEEYDFHKQVERSHDGGGQIHDTNAPRATSRELAEISWVLTQVGASPTPDVGAATEHFIRLRTIHGAAQENREHQRWGAVTTQYPGARAAFEELSSQAAQYAGPYEMVTQWVHEPTSEDPSGRMMVSVVSATGVALPHLELSLAGSSTVTPATGNVSTGESGKAVVEFTLPVPVDGPVTGELTITSAPVASTKPILFVPAEANVQRLMSAPRTTTVTGHVTASVEPRTYQPEVSTQTRDVIAQPGESAVDIVRITGGRPGAVFSGSSTLHGPFATLDELRAAGPQDAPVVGSAPFSGTYDDNGAAEVMTESSLVFPGIGYYTWVETLDAQPYVVPPAAAPWPQMSETSIVISPQLSSALLVDGARSPVAELGASLSETLYLEGVPERAVPGSDEPLRLKVSGRIAGPLPPDATGRCEDIDWTEAPTATEYTDEDLEESPRTNLTTFTPTIPGCYSAEATLVISHGGTDVLEVHHPLGDPDQTTSVTAPASQPEPTPSPEPSPTPESSPSPEPTETPETLEPTPTETITIVATPAPRTSRPGLPSTGV